MCDTIEELNRNVKTRLEMIENNFNSRFDSLEKALIIHAETPPAALSPLLQEIRTDLKEVKEQTTKTNGRVSRLEIWKATIHGMSSATKVFWGVMSVFVFGSAFGLFKAYIYLDKIEYVILDNIRDNVKEDCFLR